MIATNNVIKVWEVIQLPATPLEKDFNIFKFVIPKSFSNFAAVDFTSASQIGSFEKIFHKAAITSDC